MKFEEYNGWENRFTWMMHLHLSDEQMLAQEIAALVASTSRDQVAGRLVETWIKTAVYNWLCAHPGRDTYFDERMRLLAWDAVGSAFAFADWDELVKLLTGRIRKSQNRFTVTLHHFILSDGRLLAFVQEMLQTFPNVYECADRMKDWFREQVDTMFDGSDETPQQTSLSALVNELIQETYKVIAWGHVARAFRPV